MSGNIASVLLLKAFMMYETCLFHRYMSTVILVEVMPVFICKQFSMDRRQDF